MTLVKNKEAYFILNNEKLDQIITSKLLTLKLGFHHGDKLHRHSSTPEKDVVETIKGLSFNLHRQG